MSKRHHFFLTILSFGGDILSFWKWKKSQKIWHNSRKSPKNFFSDFCTKSVKNYPKELTFVFFFTACCWKKKDYCRVESILSKKFKDALRWNPYDYQVWGGFDGTFQFFLDFEVHFLENRFPNLFQKTTRVFNWKRIFSYNSCL